MIDKTTGKKDTVSNFPLLSPDGRLMVSKRYNPYEEYEHIPPPTEDISIYTVDNHVIKRIFLQPSRWFARELYWKDSHTIYIKTWEKEGDDAAISDYLRLTVTSGKDTPAGAPVNVSWKGTYTTVLHASSDDADGSKKKKENTSCTVPYLDGKVNGGHRMSYPLKKK
ncbi:hypothetical protein SAMN04488128_105246 [Chitinophaga eiseniae]|uniref:Uncharacterized protein n=1 Tax=Chitinophaga eiseniae TaxID=634771 RepID=A0A1T4TJT9_9BACT|nr:hypothetical protein [Chitinophaga eiseniae]SKA40707.1 hypothetical protein SAMN04488128_105246 [Chitinophaga eiseniae]